MEFLRRLFSSPSAEPLRLAMEQLRASEDQARSIIDTAFDPYIAMDAEGLVCEWNRQAETVFGWSREEVVGRSLATIIIPHRYRERHARGLQRLLATGEGPVLNKRIELSALHRDGHEFPIEITIWPTRLGETFRFNAFLQDISARQQAKRRQAVQTGAASALVESATLAEAAPRVLRAICEALGWDVGVIWTPNESGAVLRCTALWHREGRALSAFEPACRTITFAPGVGLPGRIWAQRKPAWILDVAKDDNFPRAASAAQDGLHGAFGFPILFGSEILGVVEFFSSAVEAPDERLLGALNAFGSQLGQFMQRQRAEEALAQQAAMLTRSNRELEQFAYAASHDLQEPLRMVVSYTQLLARRYKGKLDADASEFIEYAVEGGLRMQRLIQGLLAFSRARSAGLDTTLVDTEVILTRTLANFGMVMDEVAAEVTRDPLPRVMADELQLGLVLQNLIGNALKFRSTEPPRIHIGAVRQRGEWLFSVRDNGIGIEPQYMDLIFVVFKRIHYKGRYAEGTGMGLSICQKIVERHGGRIWVESTPGSGSTFFFTIPTDEA